MGTEEVAPLLYHLVRFCRPRRLLEVGMGYTTPFIARALQDNRRAAEMEARGLAAKTQGYLATGAQLDEEWLRADPVLAAPAFHLSGYRPSFLAIDNLQSPISTAGQVGEVLDGLGLADVVTVLRSPLEEALLRLPQGFLPFDFVWLDLNDKTAFFERWWNLVDPAGGIVLVHFLLTHASGEAVLEQIRSIQAARPRELEMVSLLEPHKLGQNSLTLIRRTGRYVDPRPTFGPELQSDAERVVSRFSAFPGHPPGHGA